MALNSNTLTLNLEKFMDQESSNFDSFPSSTEETAEFWANAVNEYAKLVVPPSISSDLAMQEFEKQMLLIDNSIGNGDIVFKLAFTAYATILAQGMLPNFTGIPPVTPIEFASVYALGFGGASNKICMDAMIVVIDTWFRTGTAVNTSTGTTVNWN